MITLSFMVALPLPMPEHLLTDFRCFQENSVTLSRRLLRYLTWSSVEVEVVRL